MITSEYVKPKLADEKRIESQEAVVGLTPRTIRVQGSDAELYESEENSHLVWPVLQIAGENEIIYQKVQVNGLPADLYLDSEEGEANAIVWVDERNGAAFRIGGVMSGEELVCMAESIEATKPLPKMRQSNWLPTGYCYAGSSAGGSSAEIQKLYS